MIRIYWQQHADEMAVNLPSGDQISIPVSCTVRNLDNGWRKPHEVVRTIPGNKPYNPQIFPVGKWKVYRPLRKTDKYMAPFFIPTNAYRFVDVWKLDDHGHYLEPAGYQEKDEGYGSHYSESNTTLGCLKYMRKADLLLLANLINYEYDIGGECWLEVI